MHVTIKKSEFSLPFFNFYLMAKVTKRATPCIKKTHKKKSAHKDACYFVLFDYLTSLFVNSIQPSTRNKTAQPMLQPNELKKSRLLITNASPSI